MYLLVGVVIEQVKDRQQGCCILLPFTSSAP